MVMTETERPAASARIDGNSRPGAQSPAAMRCRICSMICRYMGRASVWEMVMPLYILCIQCILSSATKGRGFDPPAKIKSALPIYSQMAARKRGLRKSRGIFRALLRERERARNVGARGRVAVGRNLQLRESPELRVPCLRRHDLEHPVVSMATLLREQATDPCVHVE